MAQDAAPKVSICRETWFYLLVLGFIIGGAVLRDVNLLFILAGMMIGPLLLNWRLVVMMLRRLEVRRRMPLQVFSGERLHVQITLSNHRRWLDCWAMTVSDEIQWEDPQSDSTTTGRRSPETVTARVLFPRVGLGDSVDGTYGMRLTRRGRYRIGPLTIRSRFPLGLVEASVWDKERVELLVCPQLGRLTRRWMQLIEADHVGTIRALRQNSPSEGDYYGLRHWQSGDSRRWIHWRTSAKLGTLAVRQFERQVHRAAAIIVDLWQPEQPSLRDLAHVELAVSFAATAVADLCNRGPSQVQLAVAGAEPCWRWGKASSALQQQLTEVLALVSGAADNRLWQLLDDVLPQLSSDVSVIIVTTRDLELEQLRGHLGSRRSADTVRILHVQRPELERYFQLEAT